MPPVQGTPNPLEGPGDYTTTSTIHNDSYDAIDPEKADFSDKTIFVNGASRGLGREMAVSFAKAGASQLVISARSDLADVVEQLKQVGNEVRGKTPEVIALKVQVSDPESVDRAVGDIETNFGKIDVLINNAAVMGQWARVGESDIDDWWNTMAVNVRGPYLMSRACIPLLLKGDCKVLVNVASVGGLLTMPMMGGYQISKTGIIRVTEFIAAEYASQGLTAFSIHPGNSLTDMIGRGEGLDEDLKGVFTETPQLCSDTLVYLTRERRQWLSGRYINCTWDMPELTSEALRRRIVEGDLLKLTLKTL